MLIEHLLFLPVEKYKPSIPVRHKVDAACHSIKKMRKETKDLVKDIPETLMTLCDRSGKMNMSGTSHNGPSKSEDELETPVPALMLS
jgi:hypothetical protein